MKRFVLIAGLLLLLMVGCTSAEATLLPTPVLPTAVPDGGQPVATTAPETLPTTGAEATAGAGLEATPTLAPTSTAVLTPTPLPQTNPPLVTPEAALPPITRDLLFIGDGALKFWDKDLRRVDVILAGGDEAAVGERRAEVGPIAGDITRYVTGDSGRGIVAAQLTVRDTVTETLPLNQYALIHIDLSDRNPRVLLPNAVNLRDFALSGDGRTVLAISTDIAQVTEEKQPADVLLIDVGSGQATQVASCPNGCSGVAWHPDDKNVVWGDIERGMYLLNIESATPTPQLLIANQLGDPQTTAVFSPIEFARNGRFLLAWQGAFEGGQRVVFDLPTAQVMPVPNSFVYADPYITQLTWMADDRIFVVRPQMPQAPMAEIYRPQPEQGRLVLEESMALPVPGSFPLGAAHLENGRFGFALIRPGDVAASGLYVLKAINDELERVNGALPGNDGWDSTSVWSADGAGAILKQGGVVLYGATPGNALYDMRPAFGATSDAFKWLPPRPQGQ